MEDSRRRVRSLNLTEIPSFDKDSEALNIPGSMGMKDSRRRVRSLNLTEFPSFGKGSEHLKMGISLCIRYHVSYTTIIKPPPPPPPPPPLPPLPPPLCI
jgi:hypothetical protein